MKRILALILAILTITALAACDEPDATTGTEIGSVSTVTDTNTATVTNTEPDPSATAPTVSAAVDYKKDVVSAYPDLPVEDLSIREHVIRIPKIDSQAPGAVALNKKILDTYSENYEILQQNKEEEHIFTTVFKYAYLDGILQVAVVNGEFLQFSEGMSHTEVYYYDPVKDKELTVEEFLPHTGLSWEKIDAAIRENPYDLMEDVQTAVYTNTLQALYIDEKDEYYCTVQVQHVFAEYSSLGVYFFAKDKVDTFRK